MTGYMRVKPVTDNWRYKRGDIYLVDLDPYIGSEQGGVRPAVVVQNDGGNIFSSVIIVVPLTTKLKKKNQPTHCMIINRGLNAPSMALCESPRPIDKKRVKGYIGKLSKKDMERVSGCLRTSLGFDMPECMEAP